MEKYNVTWERLRGDFQGIHEYEIISFQNLHGDALDAFADEVNNMTGNFLLFHPHYAPDDAYSGLVRYLEGKTDELQIEIEKRST